MTIQELRDLCDEIIEAGNGDDLAFVFKAELDDWVPIETCSYSTAGTTRFYGSMNKG